MFTLKINTDNAAFQSENRGVPDDYAKRYEVWRLLDTICDAVIDMESAGKCIDINGNVVGEWSLT